jgi:hypothetical protein
MRAGGSAPFLEHYNVQMGLGYMTSNAQHGARWLGKGDDADGHQV